MNLESLIQETAKKVIADMTVQSQLNPAGQPAQMQATGHQMPGNFSCGNIIIILDGTGEGLEHGLAEVEAVAAAGLKGQIVLTTALDAAKIQIQGFELIAPQAVVEVEDGCVVYIPYLSTGFAGKIANLFEDEAAARIVTRALLNQNKVFVGVSELDLLINGKKRLTFGISQRIKEYQRLLKSYDVVMIKDTNQVVKSCNGAPAAGIGSGVKSVSSTSNTGLGAGTANAQQVSSACCKVTSSGCEGCGKCVVLNKPGVSNVIESGADRLSAGLGVEHVDAALASMIDHTLLKPNATEAEVTKLCEEARKYTFASVCVNPANVLLAANLLQGTPVRICTVIGFPLGATTSTTKALETRDAIANGATEIDMVINVGALKSGNNAVVKKDIEAVVEAARGRAIVKVILETSLLTDEEKVRACLLCKYAGADFVKTATGFGPGGATVEDIALMRKTVGAEMGVKASGGIRDVQTAKAMIAAGASRIGASASVAIVKGENPGGKGY